MRQKTQTFAEFNFKDELIEFGDLELYFNAKGRLYQNETETKPDLDDFEGELFFSVLGVRKSVSLQDTGALSEFFIDQIFAATSAKLGSLERLGRLDWTTEEYCDED